jgi:glycerol-3-phosphate dehydrogenase (NAD(P)+)
MRIAVIGAGSWGTAMACTCGRTTETTLWARRPELADRIMMTGSNPDYLPGVPIPETVTTTTSLAKALAGAEVVVMAVPSHGFRDVLEQAAPHLPAGQPILSLTKGIERDSLLRMTEVIHEVVGGADPNRVGVLTGPNLALEVAQGQPTAAVVAIRDLETGARLQQLLMGPTFRVYTNPDVVGCESAGALKNVMGIAAGMAHGLGYGDNSMAALVTRALAELTRLGVAMGGNPLTFAGLAGMGDLIATCFSEKSRNRRVGVELGKGRPLAEIVGEMKMVAEGVKTTAAVLALAERHGIEMPIAAMVGAVINDGRLPAELVEGLMMREAKAELHGIG